MGRREEREGKPLGRRGVGTVSISMKNELVFVIISAAWFEAWCKTVK